VDLAINGLNPTPIHCRPDSERLMRAHNVWAAEWDKSDEEEEAPTLNALIQEAFNLYSDGLSPIQVRWQLQDRHPALPARLIARAQRGAERALLAAESAPPELRRAMVAATRQRAIHGAMQAGQWGAALKGLERAGDVAGELREAAGLTAEDLVLSVVVESPATLPASGESQPVSGETGVRQPAETQAEIC